MNGCPEYKEILSLDIHGELDAASRARWESHLRTCAACNEERLQLTRLVERVKEAMSPPPLVREETNRLLKAVRSGVNRGEERRSHVWQWFSRPWKVGPALATACVFAAMVSIWSLGTFDSLFTGEKRSETDSLKKVRQEDAEIIRNLDFLRQMDSVEKLVNTLDESEEDPSLPDGNSKHQGLIGHEKRVHYS
jgi:hypothetical protein